jgi:hypothetical protein
MDAALALKAPLASPTFTGTVTVPTPVNDTDAATKGYVDSIPAIPAYDKVIRTQADFDALIASPTWLGATSVALVGQFTYDEPNNSGIKVPDTVKQIHGFNSAKITITDFVWNSSTAKGGLWYDTRPTTLDYSIRDLEVDCTGTGISVYGFNNCTNLTNCTGTGTNTGTESGTWGYGFRDCTNLTNCTGTGTGTGIATWGYGFSNCTNLTNCTGKGTGSYGYGFSNCTNLTNCTGTGTGARAGDIGIGFHTITTASNCRDGGSSTNMWGGTNSNIDLDTCRKTPEEADNTELNT